MKALLPILLLFALSSVGASTTFTLQGNSTSARYSLAIKSRALSITLSSDATLSHSGISLSLGRRWRLEAKEGWAKAYYPSLGSVRMREVSVIGPVLTIRTLVEAGGTAGGISLGSGPLSVALLVWEAPRPDALFVHYGEANEGTLLLARLQDGGPLCGLDWQVSYGSHRSVAATTTLWVGAGPVRLVQRFGPSVGEREMEVRLSMTHRRFSASFRIATALGREAIYSGQSQKKQTTITSALKAPVGPLLLQLSGETTLALSSAGVETRRHIVGLGLDGNRWQLALRWRLGASMSCLYADGASSLSLGGERVGASFAKTEGPWTFTLQFGQGGTLSLLWRYELTIGRGSGSPRQARESALLARAP